MTDAATPKKPRRSRQPTADSYVNFMARLGVDQPNLSRGQGYNLNPITRNRNILEMMYRGSWIVGAAIDIYAEDMTSAGIEFTGDLEPEKIEEMNEAMTQMGFWQAILEWTKWARLYGGSVAVMLIDGADVAEPLDPKTIGKGQFKGLYVYDRWQLQANAMSEVVDELGPHLGKPKYYTPEVSAIVYSGKKIHYTRCLRMDGIRLPFFQRRTEDGWGMSIIERIFDRLTAFDSTSTGTAQLVFRAYLRTLKINGLTNIIAKGGTALAGLTARTDAIRAYQQAEGLTLLDAEDEFETHTYSFAGLDGVLVQMGQQLAGALKTPLVRLFGQSPQGMDATGEADLQNYRDGIASEQESRMRQPLGVAVETLYRSVVGADPPDGFGFSFRPLQKISLAEKAQIAAEVTNTVAAAKSAGLVSDKVALQELKQSSEITGVWTNIMDEDIEAAEDEVPDPNELLAQAGGGSGAPGFGKPNGAGRPPGGLKAAPKPDRPAGFEKPDAPA